MSVAICQGNSVNNWALSCSLMVDITSWGRPRASSIGTSWRVFQVATLDTKVMILCQLLFYWFMKSLKGWFQTDWSFFFFFNLFLAAFGLRCCTQAFSSCSQQGYSSLWCAGFSLRWLLLLQSTGSKHTGFSSCGTRASVVVALGL